MSINDIPLATPEDMARISAMLNPQGPPERIYGWLNSQLSVARHYGGITYQGHHYSIAANEPRQPLVRGDVLRKEAKSTAAKKRAEKQAVAQAQGVLL